MWTQVRKYENSVSPTNLEHFPQHYKQQQHNKVRASVEMCFPEAFLNVQSQLSVAAALKV